MTTPDQPPIRCSDEPLRQLGNDRRSAWRIQRGVEGQRSAGEWGVVETQNGSPRLRIGPDGQIELTVSGRAVIGAQSTGQEED